MDTPKDLWTRAEVEKALNDMQLHWQGKLNALDEERLNGVRLIQKWEVKLGEACAAIEKLGASQELTALVTLVSDVAHEMNWSPWGRAKVKPDGTPWR